MQFWVVEHMEEVLIKTEQLIKRYTIGEVVTEALGGVSLTIAKGEYVAINGRSGSGKSTLLHILSLLDRPTSGSVYIRGIETNRITKKERMEMRLMTFGYVFQDYALIPELTALENVLLPRYMATGCYDSCAERGKELLEQVGLSGRMDNLPNQLSGGEQQRVAIARALVNSPVVLFADEPTANLDTDTSETILSIIQRLHTEGLTVLMVTHEPEFATRAQRIITLADGLVIDGA